MVGKRGGGRAACAGHVGGREGDDDSRVTGVPSGRLEEVPGLPVVHGGLFAGARR